MRLEATAKTDNIFALPGWIPDKGRGPWMALMARVQKY